MTDNEINIDTIITTVYDDTFKILSNLYKRESIEDPNKKPPKETRTKLIIPKKRDGKIRLGEQELRFVFVEQLNQHDDFKNNFYYSIETPTKLKYKFTSKKDEDENFPTIIPDDKDGGESARIDLVIFNTNDKIVALIEFKANNQDDCKTDFLKLCGENTETTDEAENISRYFIQILTSANKNTIPNLDNKKESINNILKKQKEIYPKLLKMEQIKYICYSINVSKELEHENHYLDL